MASLVHSFVRSPLGSAALLTALLVGGPIGCGDACSEAAEKVEECGVREVDPEDEGADFECEGQIECSAECVNAATCADLQNWSDPGTDFSQCVLACQDG